MRMYPLHLLGSLLNIITPKEHRYHVHVDNIYLKNYVTGSSPVMSASFKAKLCKRSKQMDCKSISERTTLVRIQYLAPDITTSLYGLYLYSIPINLSSQIADARDSDNLEYG